MNDRACGGKAVVMGMGKSGPYRLQDRRDLRQHRHPSFFVHPAEASHGDLGMVTPQDIVLAISNPASPAEILALDPGIETPADHPHLYDQQPESSMGKAADIHLCIKVPQEARLLGLALTTSTTATLVMGDALAVALEAAQRKRLVIWDTRLPSR